MSANNATNNKKLFKPDKVLFAELSYQIYGVLFDTHNEIGRHGREKQYADLIEKHLREKGLAYKRELQVGNSGNIIDFLVENNIVIEIKAKPALKRNDFEQAKRYLDILDLELAILVNFHSKYLEPKRVIKFKNS